MAKIHVYSPYGDPRRLASRDNDSSLGPVRRSDATPHGMEPDEIADMHRRFEAFSPGLSRHGDNRRDMVQKLLDVEVPGGAIDPVSRYGSRHARTPSPWSKQAQSLGGTSLGAGSSTLVTPQRPYQPEFESPDRQQYPIHRLLANRYWRMFYKMDPIVGTCVDLLGELLWSDFQLTGEGVDGEVKDAMEAQCNETQLRAVLPFFVKEFLVVGEVCPHTYYDEQKGIWTHIALHNPDQLEIIYSPFVKMDPIAEFVPDDRLRQVVTSPNPMLRRIREMMPPELVARLSSRQNITLSPVNFTFIPRKLHPYDIRGTSILSRLWRVFMAEDALWNSFIATARRAASPLKVAKIGDASTNFIPGPEQERKLQQLLAQAELDPQAWLVWHYGINFELAGAPERVMAINNNYDLIERIKLVALGISKSFLTGEVTYASAAAGLTVFLQRLLTMREFFESTWLRPKFFKQVAIMNKWVKPTSAEVGGKGTQSQGPFMRTRRSHAEVLEDNRYIVPTIEWEKSLDPAANTERVQALATLKDSLGVRVSKRTILATVGLDYESELKQIKSEIKLQKEVIGNDLEAAAAAGVQLPGMGPPPSADGEGGGGGDMSVSPGLPPDALGEFSPDQDGGEAGGNGGDAGNAPAPTGDTGGESVPLTPGASKEGDAGAKTKPGKPDTKSAPKSAWPKPVMSGLVGLFENFDHAELVEPWDRMLMDSKLAQAAVRREDGQLLWEATEQWLLDEGYPTRAITDLEDSLASQGKIVRASVHDNEILARVEAHLSNIAEGLDEKDLFAGTKKQVADLLKS